MKNSTLVVIIIAVVIVAIGAFLIFHPVKQVQINRVVFPTQPQVSSVLGNGWNITGLYENNYTKALQQQYPGVNALYQEYIQNGNQTITISVYELNGSTTLQGIRVGKYLVSANISGNKSTFNLQGIQNLEVKTLKSQKGLIPTLSPLLIPAGKNSMLIGFGNQTSQNYTIYFETVIYNNSFASIYLLKANGSYNISLLFNYLLSTAPQNVTVAAYNGAKYFNLSVSTYYGNVYYIVGMKDQYLVFIQAQSSQAFQLFTRIINEV